MYLPPGIHQIALGIAEIYDVEYEVVIAWFCQGFGFGQILLALETAQLTGSGPSRTTT